MWVTKTHSFVPPEAETIAGEFESNAHEVESLAGNIRQIKSVLNSPDVWQGKSQREFMEMFGSKDKDLLAYAASLLRSAGKIRAIKVTESYQVWVADKK